MIVYFLEEDKSESRHVIEFLCFTLSIKFKQTFIPEEANVLYLKSNQENPMLNKIVIVENSEDVICADINNLDFDKVNFDILNAIHLFLSDSINDTTLNENLDKHDRLIFKKSYQYINHIHEFPIVNAYVDQFKKAVEKTLKMSCSFGYPDKKKAVVILSHDVDNPLKYNDLYNGVFKLTGLKSLGIIKWFVSNLKLMVRYVKDKERNEFWNFDKMLNAETKYGFKSTSFFAVTNRHNTHRGHELDVPYFLRNWRFKKVIKKYKKLELDVGLHPGYKSHENLEYFKKEKEELSLIFGQNIIGIRHHYWHTGKDVFATLSLHEQAGFEYDSSLAFNDHVGFRFNVAHAFYPFDKARMSKVETLQIPMYCMDGNLFKNKEDTPKLTSIQIKKFIDTLKTNWGVGSINWHIRTSFPSGTKYRNWGLGYLMFLEELSKDKEIWVTDCKSFYNWFRKKTEYLDCN